MNYNQHDVPGPEFRVRPVVRYVVTRYCHPYVYHGDPGEVTYSVSGGSEVIAEFPSEERAYEVMEGLSAREETMRAAMLSAPGFSCPEGA